MEPEIAGQAAQTLLAFTDQPPEEAARRIEQLIGELSDRSAARALDHALIQLLEDRPVADPILEHLDLGVLAALVRRSADRLSRPTDEERTAAWSLLDVLRRSRLRLRIAAAGGVDQWSRLTLELIEASDFTFPMLFAQRCAGYGSRVLFRVPGANGGRAITWYQVAGRVGLIARGLLAVSAPVQEPRVAILSENRLEMVLCDLACLAHGIVDVMIPATATENEVAYILRHAHVDTVVVSTTEQLAKVQHAREQAPHLSTVVAFERDAAAAKGVHSFDEILARAGETPAEAFTERRSRATIDDLATVMYTSGTTGTPKGICFSHRNIVFKRFARALALPHIGEADRFLCYLPLFHTFGRFLEMTGCIFWGSTYCFAESPDLESLVRQMQQQQPTVFISIPMKWMQLYDRIRAEVDVEAASDAELDQATRRLTGGSLRWGLSAAGYLDPEIFRFFQARGIHLMSGFGMTEATGGITMTPPGEYRDDSLGVPLPGIEVTLADDGEMLIRGPYVTTGYLDPPDGEATFDDDGWLHTGDLMERDGIGHYRIVDRKKEIYKNVQGQTVAPQKIENLFREFDSVGRIFLVGDHRPYNTALIYPNPELSEVDLSALSMEERKTHFRSLVVSANSFLAPFERIVDFAVIDRDFEADKGELTPKGTFRRKTIERNFADVIRPLYRRTTIEVGGARVTVPNWLFQALGLTAEELRANGDQLLLPSIEGSLTIREAGETTVQVGDGLYGVERMPLDLGILLSTPSLWLGNAEVVDFAPLGPSHRDRRRTRVIPMQWLRRAGRVRSSDRDHERASSLLLSHHVDLMDLHQVALLLDSSAAESGVLAVRVLEHVLELEDPERAKEALRVLRRGVAAEEPAVLRRAFQVLALTEEPARYRATVASFLDRGETLLDSETVAVLAEHDLTLEQLEAFVAETESRCLGEGLDPTAAPLLDFLASYGANHPSRYRLLRGCLARIAMTAGADAIGAAAGAARQRLQEGFRAWLGPPTRIAVDPETGLEYRWDDVVAFSDEVDADAARHLLAAIAGTTLLREGIFLFSGGTTVRLDDILPQGVWVRLLGSDHGKSVYRIAVKTRDGNQYDLAVNLNRSLTPEAMAQEIDWLILCGEDRTRPPLVETFGGFWPDHQLWTEEFIPGETLDVALRRLERRAGSDEWYQSIWPFAAWSAIGAYIDFWSRTARRESVADPTPSNVIVPMHDYHLGARLVSITNREPYRGLAALLRSFRGQFIDVIEAEHPRLRGLVGWDIVLSALLEAVGQEEGVRLLREELGTTDGDLAEAAAPFVATVERRGFLPRRLYFAAERYRRWAELNAEATPPARATTLQELFTTYRLEDLQSRYPEVRPRFFRETAFRDTTPSLADGLEDLIDRLRSQRLAPDDLSAAVADLRAHLTLGGDEDYFLARLSYPYLRPEDETGYVETDAGGIHQSEMVVTVEDRDGRPYYIRHAISPKEVARLHRLFLAARLPVQFRPDHRFLVAINPRGHLIGGLFYEVQPESHSAHMDKLVVAEPFQRQGVAGALLDELGNRLRTAGYRSLTTGFFRPQFFYRYGFTVERRYAGLVKSLGGDPGS
jgi:long-subunit acyl-CoA synthetase (AMP-forming)/GNAT superfamily N-acetyltransferase